MSPSTRSVDCTNGHLWQACKISTAGLKAELLQKAVVENYLWKNVKVDFFSNLFSSLARCSGDGKSRALIQGDDLIYSSEKE